GSATPSGMSEMPSREAALACGSTCLPEAGGSLWPARPKSPTSINGGPQRPEPHKSKGDPSLRAFVTNHTTSFETDLAGLELGPSDTQGEAFRAFSLNSGLYGFPPNGRSLGNFYFANWHGLFDEVCVGASVRLFNDAWGRAFLRHCCRALKPG